MVRWSKQEADANDLLLDRQIFDSDGEPVGKVDDLELTVPGDGGLPVLSAILCGPTALGPRIGDRIGSYWTAVPRRLRPHGDPDPARIPMEAVSHLDRTAVRLAVPGHEVVRSRLAEWTRDNVIERLPGGRR